MTMAVSDMTSPLAESLAHMAALDANLYADTGALEAGWLCAADLLAGDGHALGLALDRQAAEHPQMEARTKASYLIGELAWYVCAPLICAYLSGDAVPTLRHADTALRFEKFIYRSATWTGESSRVAVRFLGRDALLPAGDARQADQMRHEIEGFFAPVIARVSARTRLSEHALWLLVADSCASLFLHFGQRLGCVDSARAEGMQFIRTSSSPMRRSKTDYVTLSCAGQQETFCVRGGCCRYYTVSETGEKCTTCVLRRPEEREALLREYMASKLAKEGAQTA
jgi:hypothetical protein